MEKIYDIAILGSGPAGLTSAIYALRSGRSVVLVEKLMIGGQVALTQDIQNYPGFELISGFELGQKMHEQATKLGAETVYGEAQSVNFDGNIKTITTTDGTIHAKSVIIATGAKSRKLGIATEDSYLGSGVAYCAVCDGAFYKGKNVAVVGGGNSGVEDAIYLAKVANHVTLIHNKEELAAHQISVNELNELNHQKHNITIVKNSTVTNLFGKPTLSGVEITNLVTKEKSNLNLDGLFIAIGRVPDTEFLKGIVKLDKWGYIVTDEKMTTSIPGVFAAGDVRVSPLKQIVTATSDGAMAAISANSYLNQWK